MSLALFLAQIYSGIDFGANLTAGRLYVQPGVLIAAAGNNIIQDLKKDCQFKTFLQLFSNSEFIVRFYKIQNATKIKCKSLKPFNQGNLKRIFTYLQSYLQNFTSESKYIFDLM